MKTQRTKEASQYFLVTGDVDHNVFLQSDSVLNQEQAKVKITPTLVAIPEQVSPSQEEQLAVLGSR